VALADEPPVVIGSQTFYATKDGFAVNTGSARIATLREPPTGTADDERWLDIDLDQQVLVAYEGKKPVYTTMVSTGRGGGHNPLRNYLTPAGSYRIRSKHVTATMDGDTAADGPYSIEDVPWAMYFLDSYALHGAFWHNMFGFRMSHGCVNLAPDDARWVFLWARPELPEGWHIVFANNEHPGSRVEVRHSAGRHRR
jgi:lipoprotein-anchoring transpeptidase ErfK/SrfK